MKRESVYRRGPKSPVKRPKVPSPSPPRRSGTNRAEFVHRTKRLVENYGFLAFEVANSKCAGTDLVAIAPHGLTFLIKCRTAISTICKKDAAQFLSLARSRNLPAVLAYRDNKSTGGVAFKRLRSVEFEEEYWHPVTAVADH